MYVGCRSVNDLVFAFLEGFKELNFSFVGCTYVGVGFGRGVGFDCTYLCFVCEEFLDRIRVEGCKLPISFFEV